MHYIGVWYGGPRYGFPAWPDDAEVFDSIEHAKNVFWARYMNQPNLAKPTKMLDVGGEPGDDNPQVSTPAVSADCSIVLHPASATGEQPNYYVDITFGPRMGIVVEKCTR